MEDQRLSFADRAQVMGGDVLRYYTQLSDYLLTYKKVKLRLSNRCASYRINGDLICKIAIGGKTLKICLAVDPSKDDVAAKKLHFRDLSSSPSYAEVPAMIPIKSDLCVKKVTEVIDIMMKDRGISKSK